MTTLHQWLEGKKILTELSPDYSDGYNQALTDAQADSPTLLSTMEAEIRGKIGGKFETYTKGIKEPMALQVALTVEREINAERARIHTIISEYFKTHI